MTSNLASPDQPDHINDSESDGYNQELRVVICGGGIAGLGAAIAVRRKGHSVIVLEAAAQLSEIGAGIQIPPNSTRIFREYGLEEKLRDHVVWPRNISMKRYATGQELGSTPVNPYCSERYGFPYWLIHRADYQRLLYERAIELGVEVVLSARVAGVDEGKPSVTTADGREFEGDVVVGADGIRSPVRAAISQDLLTEPRTRMCAFRATVNVEDMMSDPDTALLMTDRDSHAWMGPDRHIMAYPIRKGAMYNLVMPHPGQAKPGEWNVPGDIEELRATYADFDPVIQKVIKNVTSCLKWTLADLPPLKSWLSESGKVVLIGDAAHAMVPFLAQGASMSIEDGACLGECLGAVRRPQDIPDLLSLFEKLRKSRAERVQAASLTNGTMWHLHDGPEQEARDLALKDPKHAAYTLRMTVQDAQIPNPWADKNFQPFLFGYDAIRETTEALKQNGYQPGPAVSASTDGTMPRL